MIRVKTIRDWERILNPTEIEALHETYYEIEPEETLSASEVLDAILEWNGGINSGYHILAIINRLYDTKLE